MKSNDMDQDLIAELRRLGRDASREPQDEALCEPEALAAWLDGVASDEQAQSIEALLADSPALRELAADVSAAAPRGHAATDWAAPSFADSSSRRSTPASRRMRRRWPAALAAAAAVVVLVVGAWRLMAWDARLGELGVSRVLAVTQPAHVAELRSVLEGRWPLPSFEPFIQDSGDSELRGAESVDSAEARLDPEPLSPRWSAVREGSPTFTVSGSGVGLRLLIIDTDENLVGDFGDAAFRGSAMGGADSSGELSGIAQLAWPQEVSPLAPGLYAWKVRADGPGVAPSSAWVPFRVLDPAAVAALERRLEGLGDFQAAVELAQVGLVDEALVRIEKLDSSEHRARLSEQLRQSVESLGSGAG